MKLRFNLNHTVQTHLSTVASGSWSLTSTVSGSSAGSPGRLVRVPSSAGSAGEYEPQTLFSGIEDTFAFGHLLHADQLKVVIVGSGYAGLSAAIACARQGMSVTVLERSSGISVHGDSITFGANAGKILFRWGVGEEMLERSSRGGFWLFKDDKGNSVYEEDLRNYPGAFGAPLLQGHRAQFLGTLGVEARMLQVTVRTECEATGYYDSEEPAVVLRSGEVVRADVVIIADGVHSTARQLLAPHGWVPTPKQPSGYSIYRSAMSAAQVRKDRLCAHFLDGNIRTWISNDSHAMIYPLDNGKQLAFALTRRDGTNTASINWRDRKPITEVLDLLQGWDPALIRAISYFKSTLNWAIFNEPPADEWVSARGRIAFVGDAIHAMHPTSFQGGSQAIEDGATLAICLALAGGTAEGVPLGLEVYEAMRRPRTVEVQQMGHMQQRIWHSYTTSPTVTPSSLSPLCTRMFSHDAEVFALDQFEPFARSRDINYRLSSATLEKVTIDCGLERGAKKSMDPMKVFRGRLPKKPSK